MGWRPRQLSENESKQNSVKGFVLTYPQYLCGYGGRTHTRFGHPPLMDWLATGADVRLKLSQTPLPSISLDFRLYFARRTFTELLFSESCRTLCFVLGGRKLNRPTPPTQKVFPVTWPFEKCSMSIEFSFGKRRSNFPLLHRICPKHVANSDDSNIKV